jgi:hypothetical protein
MFETVEKIEARRGNAMKPRSPPQKPARRCRPMYLAGTPRISRSATSCCSSGLSARRVTGRTLGRATGCAGDS